jgi:hypothetical protein
MLLAIPSWEIVACSQGLRGPPVQFVANRRVWRKIHVSDPGTQSVIAVAVPFAAAAAAAVCNGDLIELSFEILHRVIYLKPALSMTPSLCNV